MHEWSSGRGRRLTTNEVCDWWNGGELESGVVCLSVLQGERASSVVRLNVLGATTGCMGVRARRTWWFLNYDSCETKSCMMHELLTLTRGAVESTIDIRGVLVYLPPGLRTCTSAPADRTFPSFSRLLLPAQLMNIRRFH